jgi:NIMA (never in mitosis gene a)-related kinase 1/4/5
MSLLYAHLQARILSKLDHPYIVKHYKSFIEDETLHIIMELAKAGTLYDLRNGPGLEEQQVWKYSIQLLMAMEYIHKERIIHRDIKTLNLFLDDQGNLKLGELLL